MQHLARGGIGGQAPLVDAIAVVLGHQFTGGPIELDQEVAARIQGDKPLRQLVVEGLPSGGGGNHGAMLIRGPSRVTEGERPRLKRRPQGRRRGRERQLGIDRLDFLQLLGIGLGQPLAQ